MFQWLKLHVSNAGAADSIPGEGTKIPHARQCSKNIFFIYKIIIDIKLIMSFYKCALSLHYVSQIFYMNIYHASSSIFYFSGIHIAILC